MNKPLKFFLTFGGIAITIAGGSYLFLHIVFGGFFTDSGPFYDKQDLIENYESKKTEILEVKNYVEEKNSTDIYFDIEFENDDLGIFHVEKDGDFNSNWNLELDSPKTDSLLTLIGWTKNDLKLLKDKLDKANCTSVASGNPITIGWQRSGMGKFSYNIFNENLTDTLISQYNGGCTHIFYKENVVLEYGGGAIGPQCFPEE
jgi:hypothetical protein